MSKRVGALLPYLAVLVIAIAVLNFFWFIAESVSIGTASTGRIVNGHYFLNDHGTYTEVSRAAWEWSLFHQNSTWVTHLLGMVSMGYLLFRSGFPAMMGSPDPAANGADAQSIRSSGPRIAAGRTAGRIGGLSFGGPLLGVSAYAGGILVKPVFMGERAIPLSAIKRITVERSRRSDRVVVDHLGPGSPFVVLGNLDGPVAKAIVNLAPTSGSSPLDAPAPPVRRRGLAGALSQFSFRVSASGDSRGIFDAFPPGVGALLFVLGLAVTGAMLALAVTWAIPKLGLGGYIWTAGIIAIAVYNARQFLRRR